MSDSSESNHHKPGGILLGVYALSMGVLVGVAGALVGTLGPLWGAAAGYLAATLVIFVASVITNNSSMYDAFWSVAPPFLGVWAWLVLGPPEALERGLLAMAIMFWWGYRLTFSWWRGWPGMHHEDWRYVDFRNKTGKGYWPVSFFAFHFFPSVQTFLGTVPLLFAVAQEGVAFGWLDGVATVLGVTAVMFEMVADRQLHEFVNGPRKPEDILETGLWAYSRHPNYFGEALFWWSMWLFGLSAGAPLWTIVGAVSITLMLFGFSLPMIETRMLKKRPHYRDVQRRVSVLIPFFRRE